MTNVNPIQVEKYLKGVDYPVNKDDLIRQAEENGADERIREVLKKLPETTFESPTQVSKAVAGVNRDTKKTQ